jgi:D-aspartate ligase
MAIRVHTSDVRSAPYVSDRVRNADVVIAGLYINASADLRRLSSLGYSLVALTADPDEVGVHSRHGEKLLCPHPAHDFEAWLHFMEELGQSCRMRPALVPTSESYVLALDRAAKRLMRYFRFIGFGSGLRTALTSKRRTFEIASHRGFPAPLTRFASHTEHVAEIGRDMRYPAIIKPEFSRDWSTPEASLRLSGARAITVGDEAELVSVYGRIAPYSRNVVVQEFIPGPDQNLIYWAGFVGPDSTTRGRFVGRKQRVTPVHVGSASFVELVDMPDVEHQCETFLRAVEYTGRCGIEMKIDERDGVAKLIDINPRTGLWEDVGVAAGVDLAAEEIDCLFGGDPPVRRTNGSHRRWVHIGRDLRAFKQYRSEGALGWVSWIRSLKPPITVSDMPWVTDFPYAWANVRSILRAATAFLFRRRNSG